MLKFRSRNVRTDRCPIPCDALVTIAVFSLSLIVTSISVRLIKTPNGPATAIFSSQNRRQFTPPDRRGDYGDDVKRDQPR